MLRRMLTVGLLLLAVVGCSAEPPTPGGPTFASSSPTEDTRLPIEKIIGPSLKMDHSVLPEGITQGPSWGQVTFHPDGTVTGDESLTMISNPTHWRRDGDILKLCTSEDCEYWSEWFVRIQEPAETASEGEEEKPLVFELVFANAKDEEGNEIIRILKVTS